ncbi:MAG: PAS domain S-box protein, partial [Thermodesulfobacteriota bacterium]|nr:PAS domain S-box protein [Thermodesulfobacteriota bacterium]
MKTICHNSLNREVKLLNEAFLSFNESNLKLQEHYRNLEEEVRQLNKEIEEKNKVLEKNLKEKEEVKNYLHNVLESLSSGIIVKDSKNAITVFNLTAEKITGYTRNDAIGKDFYKFSSKLFSKELLSLLKSGKKIETFECETILNKKNEESIKVKLSISPLKNLKEEVKGFIYIFNDISELKGWEDQAKRKGQLLALGEMAVNTAHEIRNPLGSIELFASLMVRELEDNKELKKLAVHIIMGVHSLNHVVSNMLAFTKTHKFSFQKFKIHSLLEETLQFNQYLFKEHNIILETN